MERETFFAFDLDGTITKDEILPIISKNLNLEDEMRLLTKLTLNGTIGFEQSFKLRVAILKSIPISKINSIVQYVNLDRNIFEFIQKNKERCAVVTGNLDVWIKPIVERLGCKCYSSKAKFKNDTLLGIDETLVKSKAILDIKRSYNKVVTIGESINDIPMFTEGDIGIAYGGVHEPVKDVKLISNYVVYRSDKLCQLLNTLL